MIRLVFLLAVFGVLLAAAPARSTEWTVDPSASRLGFTAGLSGTPFEGRFARWEARVSFDPAQLDQARVEVKVDMASAATGDRQRDEALPEAEWFDVKNHPQAKFEAAKFRATGGAGFEAIGTLTIRGVKQEVALPFTFDHGAGDGAAAARFSGGLTLIRTDFDVGQGAWRSAQWVDKNVTVSFTLTATPTR